MQCVNSRRVMHLGNPTGGPQHGQEDAIDEREYPLAVLCRIPSFLCPWAWSEPPHAVDVSDTIKLLQATTWHTAHNALEEGNGRGEATAPSLALAEGESSVTYKSWIDCIEGHVSSLLDTPKPRHVSSSWSGMHAATAVYENFVIDRVNPSFRMKSAVLYHILSMVVMDLEETRDHLQEESAPIQGALWFWKAFIGSFSIRAAQQQQHQESPRDELLRRHFDGLSREAALHLRINSWHTALEVLAQVAWPTYSYQGSAFASIWLRITEGNESE